MTPWIIIPGCLAAAGLGFGLGYLFREYLARTRFRELHDESERILSEARTKYREIELEAKDLALRLREEAEVENKRRRAELRVQEQRVQQRRESLDRRMDALEAHERELQTREKGIEHKEAQVEELRVQAGVELERVAGMDRQEARVLLLQNTEQETRQDLARVILDAATSPATLSEAFIATHREPVRVRDLVRKMAGIVRRPIPPIGPPVALLRLAGRAFEAAEAMHLIRGEPPVTREKLATISVDRAYRIDKMRRLLGTEPPTSLDDGLRRTAQELGLA